MIQTAARPICRAPMFAAVIPTADFIPPITDPLGRHWRQPDLSEVQMDGIHVLLTRRQFDELADYSTTRPDGVYVGKCWKSRESVEIKKNGKVIGYGWTDRWLLRWFGESEIGPGYCSNKQRIILIID